jgi:MinD superfamily P-loop ATPase
MNRWLSALARLLEKKCRAISDCDVSRPNLDHIHKIDNLHRTLDSEEYRPTCEKAGEYDRIDFTGNG